ncbi:MAG TPA: glutamate synthase subunit beta, partial [Acidimicrobiales bacterium]|nr:glutamate synthase subunit beta [Acidimicrobiales bacterium]
PTGFLEYGRELPRRRPVQVRLRDWREIYEPFEEERSRQQGARCMDCGIPFCHEGCPLGNLIPEWNDLVYRGDWFGASERLHATNNFPEFTGRLCPAPCEAACVLGINADPVTIERIEYEIAERAWSEGWVRPHRPRERTGRRVAVVGSGPAGLACAQQLARAGHEVVVFERAEAPGGLLRFGIPEFKMEKRVLDRRLAQLRAEGVEFRCATSVGLPPGSGNGASAGPGEPATTSGILEPGEARGPGAACAPDVAVVSAVELRRQFDAIVLAGGATLPRDLPVPGRSLRGVHFALEYLKPSNLVQEGRLSESPISAAGKKVVIIGGGDTGADCLGTAHRQGAVAVHQLEIMPEPPLERSPEHPWPLWPVILRTSSAHEEGGHRLFSVTTTSFEDDGTGAVKSLRGHQVEVVTNGGPPSFAPVPGSEFELPCDLVLLAMGFVGAERRGVVAELGIELDPRGSVAARPDWSTNVEGVFVCGDMTRGQSLIVWAIAEGRSAARSVDQWLMGTSDLPAPIEPGRMSLR